MMNAPPNVRMADPDAVRVDNPDGKGGLIVVCEHASNAMPERYCALGLSPEDLTRHIAWDPGAAPVARALAASLDAPLVECGVSRLVVDCNRPLDAADLVAETSETTAIPGNLGLSLREIERRVAAVHAPFHAALSDLVEARLARGLGAAIVTIHSFNPVYRGVDRPWHVGIIHDEDDRLAAPLVAALKRDPALVVGVNQPYAPADRVYYTLERHARPRGLACAMVEIRNDLIAAPADQREWAARLGAILRDRVAVKPAVDAHA